MGGPAVGESCWLGSTPDHEQAAHKGEAGCGEGPLGSGFPSKMSQEEEDGH